jgi:hypothetical protein
MYFPGTPMGSGRLSDLLNLAQFLRVHPLCDATGPRILQVKYAYMYLTPYFDIDVSIYTPFMLYIKLRLCYLCKWETITTNNTINAVILLILLIVWVVVNTIDTVHTFNTNNTINTNHLNT